MSLCISILVHCWILLTPGRNLFWEEVKLKSPYLPVLSQSRGINLSPWALLCPLAVDCQRDNLGTILMNNVEWFRVPCGEEREGEKSVIGLKKERFVFFLKKVLLLNEYLCTYALLGFFTSWNLTALGICHQKILFFFFSLQYF